MKKRNTRKTGTKETLQRVDRHLAACSAAAAGVVGLMASGTDAKAAVIYSGLANVPIFDGTVNGGVYIDLETGLFAQGTRPAGWDINPYYSGTSLYVAANTKIALSGANAANLAPGTMVDGSLAFSGVNFYGPVNITPGQTGYVGFSFDPDTVAGVQTWYGWFQMSVAPNTAGNVGYVTSWAYDDSGAGLKVGVVPEPSSIALLAMGAAGIIALRRRRAQN